MYKCDIVYLNTVSLCSCLLQYPPSLAHFEPLKIHSIFTTIFAKDLTKRGTSIQPQSSNDIHPPSHPSPPKSLVYIPSTCRVLVVCCRSFYYKDAPRPPPLFPKNTRQVTGEGSPPAEVRDRFADALAMPEPKMYERDLSVKPPPNPHFLCCCLWLGG